MNDTVIMNKKRMTLSVLAVCICLCTVLLFSVLLPGKSEAATAPTLKIAAGNLSFEDTVCIVYAVSSENVDADSIRMLYWTEPMGSDSAYVKGSEAYSSAPLSEEATVGGKLCKMFKYEYLWAKEMTDDIYARAYVEVNGTVYYSNVVKYSALQYAYNKLGYTGTATTDERLKNLLFEMMEYGAAAQLYESYRTDNLSTDAFSKINLTGAKLPDGFAYGLYKEGTSVTLTANADPTKPFVLWKDESGNAVGIGETLTITVAEENKKYTAERSATEINSYSVVFKDYDGSVLATLNNVAAGAGVAAPIVPTRPGYTFTGWDKPLTGINENTEITAQYSAVHNQIYFSFADNGDGTTTMTVSVEGEVNLYGLEMKLYLDVEGMEYASLASQNGGLAANNLGSYIMVSFVDVTGSDLTAPTSLLKVVFNNTADRRAATVTVTDVDIFDEVYSDETYSVFGNSYHN